jgi:hypothetical protein
LAGRSDAKKPRGSPPSRAVAEYAGVGRFILSAWFGQCSRQIIRRKH